jgi:predicted component of type VI protein secretion system
MGISTEDASSANLPRLVNLNQDPLLSGALIYYLQPGETKLGSGEELQKPRIQLLGLGVAESHCTINHKDNGEVLVIKDGTGDAHTYVNGARVKHSARLRDGDRVIIGNNNAFVFLHPEDRARRERFVVVEWHV